MRLIDDRLVYWATDLSNFLACPHLTVQTRAVEFGAPRPRTFDDPAVEVLRQRGHEHESAFYESLREGGLATVDIPPTHIDDDLERWRVAFEATIAAMQGGADVIYQGTLFDGQWLGRPDFLRRTDQPSDLGDWSYEVIDAKLAREAKAGALLQIMLYSDLLGAAQGAEPEHMHLALGGPDAPLDSFRVADYAAYYRLVRRRFVDQVELEDQVVTYPEPVSHCDVCDWAWECNRKRHEDDHLSLVAGITRLQRDRLEERDVRTLASLSTLDLPLDPPLEGVSERAFERIREQARVQAEGRNREAPYYEFLLPVEEGKGLAGLPEPSDGDLFFDIEGDQFVGDEGLEYLFGVADANGDFTADWALDPKEEKRVFERFVDSVVDRLERHPDLHVYHYAPYEPTHIKQLAARHATREEEVDRLLKGEVFLDLYRIVRQSIRASVESYSIKMLEPFFGYERDEDLREANSARAHFDAWLELGGGEAADPALQATVEAYNRDDVLSTLQLRDWLEELRLELTAEGSEVGRPPIPEAADEQEADGEATEAELLLERLTDDLPENESEWSENQRARWILGHLLEWYRREDKPMWWEYFSRRDLTVKETLEDRLALGSLEYEGVVGEVARSWIHRYRFPPQSHGIKVGSRPGDPSTDSDGGKVLGLDDDAGLIDLSRSKNSDVQHLQMLVPLSSFRANQQKASLLRLAETAVRGGLDEAERPSVSSELLLGRPPRVGQDPGDPLMEDGDDSLEVARRLSLKLEETVLPIQGPPGSGKTYTGARMIVSLLRAGKRVGVTATSHQVITNLLSEVCDAAREEGAEIRGIQKAGEDEWCGKDRIERTGSNPAVVTALESGAAQIAGGTAFLWSREEMAGSVDVLFVDEAGQMSLANVLAVSQAAPNLVLLGDPRQLEQPQKGVHPPGCDLSALDHLLNGEITVPPERGLFLAQTWRLHPDICSFTSEQFYLGRLRSRPDLANQAVQGPEPFKGSGLRFVPVVHSGNRTHSPEEVVRVAELLEELFGSSPKWTNRSGANKPLGLSDVLIVAPYNDQVSALREGLPAGARVGTVDKFQGQEAPIVIYSMATSTAAEAPRGMEFLFSANRLNVATSRARCVVVLVGNPELFAPECRSIRQMWLANSFCRYMELAGQQESDPAVVTRA